tara:strand:+ start:757 stop:993 length:237 start_codon:yes stop_codon:yes gene_type:complete
MDKVASKIPIDNLIHQPVNKSRFVVDPYPRCSPPEAYTMPHEAITHNGTALEYPAKHAINTRCRGKYPVTAITKDLLR